MRDNAQLSASYAWCQALAGETDGVAEWLDDAERALAAGRDGGPAVAAMIPAELALLRSRLASLEGDSATAIAEARLARTLVPAGLPATAEATLRGDASVLLAVALARGGDSDRARTEYLGALPDLRAGGNAFAVGRAIADLAAIEIAQGDPAAALRWCEAELERSSGEAAASSPAVWAAMARAYAELGRPGAADAAGRRALEFAGQAGDLPSAKSAQATLDQVASVLAGEGRAGVRSPGTAATGGLVEELSPRELEVLRLVALGHSNNQIASELYVTVGTVKAHLHNISGKLGVANRTEAVARGRDLGLLA